MNKKNRLYLIAVALCLLVFAIFGMWTYRYYLVAYYDLFRVDYTAQGNEILYIAGRTAAYAPHILPLLERTYRNTKLSERRRYVAASALIEADPARADKLFMEYLKHKDEKIVANAIRHLSYSRSKIAFQEVIGQLKSPNPEIRKEVVGYLDAVYEIQNATQILEQISKSDPSSEVRTEATRALANAKRKAWEKIPNSKNKGTVEFVGDRPLYFLRNLSSR